MAEFVEGDWKKFTFKMTKPEDYPRILEHLRQNFYLDEPINKYLGQGEEKNRDMDKIAIIYMQQNLSFYAVDKNSGKIAGVRVTGIARKEDNPEELFSILDESQEAKDLLPNIIQLVHNADTYEKLNIDHYGDFLFVSVDREYRGEGLATEMYIRAIKLLKAKGCPAAQSIFSSPYSQRIAKKLGFVELGRLYFKDFKKTDGQPLLPMAMENEVSIAMAVKF